MNLLVCREANDPEALDELSEKLTRECDSLFVNEEFVLTEKKNRLIPRLAGRPIWTGSTRCSGRWIEGLDVLDKIVAVKTNSFDRPVKDICD